MAQIELGIEGTRICTCDGYIPAIIRTRDGYVPAIIRTRNGNVPVTALRNVDASRPAYRHTVGLLSTYDLPAIGVRSACYRRTIGLFSAYDAYNRL